MQQLKSFWAKPQGKVGMAVLALMFVALGLGFMNYLLPYATTFVDGWLHIGMTLAVVFFLGWFYVNFHSRFALIFKLIITRLTNAVYRVMPIDVLKENVAKAMKKQRALEEQSRVFTGQIRVMEDNIARNESEADKQMRLAMQARKMKAKAEPNSIEFVTYAASETEAANEAQRKQDSNVAYRQMLKQMEAIGNVTERMKIAVAFFVRDRTAVVKEAEFKYNALKKAHKAVSTASSILRGDVDEEMIFSSTLDYVNMRDSEMIGDIENYQKLAEEFVRKSDLETGAMNDRAMEQLNAYEQKLLAPENPLNNLQSAMAAGQINQQKQSVVVPQSIPSGYDDLYK
jgi:hypothetical protein